MKVSVSFLAKSKKIVKLIDNRLEEKDLLRKDLAKLLKKSEPEISKLMSGKHNFTLKMLVKIETVLRMKII